RCILLQRKECWKCAFQHTPTFSIEPKFREGGLFLFLQAAQVINISKKEKNDAFRTRRVHEH
ncbi:hypothetical protein, partial [[Clostridium] symbiosum]|uniref:hypothetical protein n=1 Tax=Clostridium symbiosum TaxID=1512 RepID=UPI0034A262C3